jgi:hypothetical protein
LHNCFVRVPALPAQNTNMKRAADPFSFKCAGNPNERRTPWLKEQ